MKILLFVPQQYGFYDLLVETFKQQNLEVYSVDYRKITKKWEKKIDTQHFRMPDSWRQRWESYFYPKINKYYIEEYNKVKPDIVFVYNHEFLLPETVQLFKKKSKFAMFLGDSPMYTVDNRYFLHLLFSADAIFSACTFWMYQFGKMGIDTKIMHHFVPGIPVKEYFPKELSPALYNELKSDALYVGICYPFSWGYRKARFLSHFTDFDLQIVGNHHWKKWFRFFPELEPHYREPSGYVPVERMNEMYNATKIIPIDGNPGLLNGVHYRMCETLGSGALPLLEWQHDLNEIFPKGSDIPAVKSYNEIKEMATYYLNNEAERKEKVAWMRKIVLEKYSPENNGKLILGALNFD